MTRQAPWPHIPRHNAEHKGIGQGHKFCRVQFIVGRQAVHLYKHLKGA